MQEGSERSSVFIEKKKSNKNRGRGKLGVGLADESS